MNASTVQRGFTATGLANGTTYYFAVTASNPAGTSASSNEVSARPAGSGGSGTLLSQQQPATASAGHQYGYSLWEFQVFGS